MCSSLSRYCGKIAGQNHLRHEGFIWIYCSQRYDPSWPRKHDGRGGYQIAMLYLQSGSSQKGDGAGL